MREAFRDRFIRHIIEQVCLGNTPWHNPPLSSLQYELNRVYPTHRIRLHSDDAGVIPVSFNFHPNANTKSYKSPQTLRNLGVLRNQIGNEGVTAVIKYLPSQYSKRMLGSKDARAGYIAAVLADPQRPFIWELFRPGTVPRLGYDRGYYDEVIFVKSSTDDLIELSDRNVEVRSSPHPSFRHFRSTSPAMESKLKYLLPTPAKASARLAHLPSQLRR